MRRGVSATDPELSDEAIGIFTLDESTREGSDCRGHGRRRYNHYWLRSRRINVGDLIDSRVEITSFKRSTILLIDVITISEAQAPPPSRIDLDTSQRVYRTILKCIRSPATHVVRGSQLQNGLEMPVDRKVETNTRNQLVRSIQQGELARGERALRIGVQPVAGVDRDVDRTAQASIHEQG